MKKLLIACLLLVVPLVVLGATTYPKVNLQWDANTESDMAFYRVYLNGERVGIATHPTTTYTHQTMYEGNHAFYVTAVDVMGNESGPSNSVSVNISIPPEPPANCRATVVP